MAKVPPTHPLPGDIEKSPFAAASDAEALACNDSLMEPVTKFSVSWRLLPASTGFVTFPVIVKCVCELAMPDKHDACGLLKPITVPLNMLPV